MAREVGKTLGGGTFAEVKLCRGNQAKEAVRVVAVVMSSVLVSNGHLPPDDSLIW